MEQIRVLRYFGPETWVKGTLERGIQGGIQMNLREGIAGIQEIRLPVWISWILLWWLRKQPRAMVGGHSPFAEIDEKNLKTGPIQKENSVGRP